MGITSNRKQARYSARLSNLSPVPTPGSYAIQRSGARATQPHLLAPFGRLAAMRNRVVRSVGEIRSRWIIQIGRALVSHKLFFLLWPAVPTTTTAAAQDYTVLDTIRTSRPRPTYGVCY